MKKIYFLLFIISTHIITCSFAQITKQWDKTFGGNFVDALYAIQPASDGGFLLAGQSQSNKTGDKTDDRKGFYDYWIIKIDAVGNKLWDKTIGGNGSDHLYTAQSTPDDGFLLVGYSDSNISGDKTENNKGFWDYWIVKIDKDGNILWDKTFGGSNKDEPHNIQPTNDGGFLIGGSSESDISGDKSENSKGAYDYWVIKIDKDGNKLWDKTYGGNANDFLYAIQSTRDSGFLLGGISMSDISGDKTENNKGFWDYWIIKIDKDGNKVWDRTYGGNGEDHLLTIQSTPSVKEGFLLGGDSESGISGDKTEKSEGYYDYWIIRIDEYGNKVWDKTYGGSEYDTPWNIKPTVDGGYLLIGNSYSGISGKKTEDTKGDCDYWIIKINSSGNKVWDRVLGGSSADATYITCSIGSGEFLMGGISDSNISGDKSENKRGNTDYWIIKIKDNSLILPVHFIDFNLKKINANDVELYWSTATEEDNKSFTIQRSSDAQNWKDIETISGKGTTSAKQEYATIDTHSLRGINYYRIQQIDLNGTISYSVIQSIYIQKENEIDLYVDSETGQMYINSTDEKEEIKIKILNCLGQEIKTMIIHSGDQIQIDKKDQWYFVIIETKNTIVTKRIDFIN